MMKKKDTILAMVTSGMISIFIFVVALAVVGMLPGQKYYFLHGDGFSQIMPYARLFVRNVIEGKSLTYSFETGMGMPTVAIYAYYVLSPFNIFLLIPDIEVAGVCIVCAKLAFISVSMCLLLKTVFATDNAGAVMLSVSYALCSFFSSFFLSYIFLDMLYLLPLIVLAMVRFVRTGKWGWLCVVYTCSFVIQFYCAYMIGIFSAVLFTAYAWYRYGKNAALWKKAILRYFFCVLTAVLLSAPLLIPAAYELFSLYASDALKLDGFMLFPWSFIYGLYPGYLGQMQQTNNTAPLMYAGIPAVILAVLFFLDSSNSRREKIFAGIPVIFLTLCSFIKPLYIFMHAFDAPNFYAFRFSWMMDFCLILIAAKELKVMSDKGVTKKLAWTVGAAWILLYFLIYLIELGLRMPEIGTMSMIKGGVTAGFTIIYMVIFFGSDSGKHRNMIAAAVVSVELFANFLCGQVYVQGTIPERNVYSEADARARESLANIEKTEQGDPWEFYRIRYLNSLTDNISMVYGFRGLGWFGSIENERIRKFLNNYGYAGKNLQAYDYGSTQFMQMLLAQKYDIRYRFYTETQDGAETFGINEYTLPLGYMVSPDIKEYSTEPGSPFAAQNALASAMCGEEHNVYAAHTGTCYVEPENMDISRGENGTSVRRTADEGILTFCFEPEKSGNVYAYMRRWGETSYTKAAPLIYSDLDIGGMSNLSRVCMPHILPLGRDEDGLCRLYLYSNTANVENFDYEALYFAYEDKQEIVNVYNELLPGALEVTSFRDDRIVARVNVSSDKEVLFTTIPYSEEWDVYVDGVKTDSFAVLDGTFLGADLMEGEHEVVFQYHQEWIVWGIGCALLGILCIAVSIGIERMSMGTKRSLTN